MPEPLWRLASMGKGHPILMSTSLYPFSMNRDKIFSAFSKEGAYQLGNQMGYLIIPGFDSSHISMAESAFFESYKWGIISIYTSEAGSMSITVKHFGVTL